MSDYLTEEEQIEAFKRWWKQNGALTIGAVVLASAGYFGFGAYESAQEKTAQANSALYDELVTTVTAGDDAALTAAQQQALTAAADKVLAADSTGLYADLSRFHLAKAAVDAGDYAKAQEQLEAVISKSKTDSSIDLASLRLARVKVAAGDTDGALALVARAPTDAFTASYAEVRGDILQGLGRLDEAYTAYDSAVAALEKQESNSGMRANILKFKMDNVSVASTAPALPSINPHGVNPHAMPEGK